MEEVQNFLSGLPNDALTLIVSYLSTRQALELSMLNSWFRQALSFSTLKDPIPLISRIAWQGLSGAGENRPCRSVWIPTPLFSSRTHSIVMSCFWRGRDSESTRGKLYIMAVPSQSDPNEETLDSIENGTIVYESPPAPRTEESLTLSFSPSPDKAYYLWYRVGGGDARYHLCVNNLSMRTLIYDYSEKWIGRTYEALHTVGFLESRNRFSLDMLLSIATVPAKDRIHFRSFLEQYGFEMSETCAKALAEVATALHKQDDLKVKHESFAPPEQLYERIDLNGGGVMEIIGGNANVAPQLDFGGMMMAMQVFNAADEPAGNDDIVDNGNNLHQE